MYSVSSWPDSAVAWCRTQGCTAAEVSDADFVFYVQEQMYQELLDAADAAHDDEQ
jgi:hypothetical protein